MPLNILVIGTDILPPYTTMEGQLIDSFERAVEDTSVVLHKLSIRVRPLVIQPRPLEVVGPTRGMIWVRKFFYGLSMVRIFRKVLVKADIDVVHFYWVGFPVLTKYLIRLCRKRKIKVITTILNKNAVLDRYSGSDCLIVQSEASRSRLRAAGFNVNQIVVIPPCVDRRRYYPSYKPPKRYMVFASGPHTEGQIYDRGVDLLFAAFVKIQEFEPELKLYFFGRWEEGAVLLHKLAADYQASNVVFYEGYVPDMEIVIQDALGVIIPLRSARVGDVPLSAIQSFACGRPVVATKGLGLDEYIERFDAGLSAVESADGIAEAVRELLSDYPRYEQGALKASTFFDEGEYARAILNLYQSPSGDILC